MIKLVLRLNAFNHLWLKFVQLGLTKNVLKRDILENLRKSDFIREDEEFQHIFKIRNNLTETHANSEIC